MKINILEAKKTLLNSGLVVFPTETVYGLGGNAFSKEVTDRIYLIKQRPRNKPFPLLITLKWLKKLCLWNDSRIDDLIEAFWPGPLTLILNSNPDFFQSMIFSVLLIQVLKVLEQALKSLD